MNYPFDKFEYISNLIIDNLEGGYYHPDFYINGAATANGGRISASAFVKADYGRSGETLFGLDRHAGWDSWYKSKRKTSSPQENLKYIYGNVYQFIDDDAKKFWTTLDNLDARHKWPYGYLGGNQRTMLKDLCIKMMYRYFLNNVWIKLNDEGKKLVIEDNKLAFNYIYSAWNGIGFSNYYTKIFNTQLQNGIKDSGTINQKILDARASSKSGLIRDSAKKIKKVFPKIKDKTTSKNIPVVTKKKNGQFTSGKIGSDFNNNNTI